MGNGDSLRLLLGGDLPQDAYRDHIETLLAAPPDEAPDAALRTRFAQARLDWGPYARASGRPSDGAAPDMPPVLDDTDWQSLRGICEA